MKGTFRSLHNYNYRVWASGALISNIGTWMQRTAQDWLVLVQLTHESATAVGIVMALQFGPYLLLMPFTGLAADYFDRRKLVMTTQALLGVLALALGVLTITGVVQLWQVYVFAFLFGCVSAFDSTVRQTFVAELVGDKHLSNAVALNSTSFNAARMIGPAVAGVLIAAIGSGWVFLLNAASFAAVLASLRWLRVSELRPLHRSTQGRASLSEGFAYVRSRPDLMAILWMYFLIGTFGLNFPIFISTMSVTVFQQGSSQYGVLTSCMAVGSVMGALLSASRTTPRMGALLVGALLFGMGTGLAAIMPGYWWFGLTLTAVGIAAQTFTTTANSTVQLSTDPAMRGRVMAIFLAISVGGTPLGAPIVGWVADVCGPRWALGIGATSGVLAAAVALRYLVKHRGLRVWLEGRRVRHSLDAA